MEDSPMTLAKVFVDFLNRHLSSRLIVEIERVEQVGSTGQANLTALGDATASRLAELEQHPGPRLPQAERSEEGNVVVVWHVRARRDDEQDAPVVSAVNP